MDARNPAVRKLWERWAAREIGGPPVRVAQAVHAAISVLETGGTREAAAAAARAAADRRNEDGAAVLAPVHLRPTRARWWAWGLLVPGVLLFPVMGVGLIPLAVSAYLFVRRWRRGHWG